MRVYWAQVEVARGVQRLSGFDFETISITSCVLFGIFVCFLVRKALCMQFGTLTWGLLLCFLSLQHGISTWLQHSIAGCRCSFSIDFGRGQGSAAGAAEDHMMCMLDA